MGDILVEIFSTELVRNGCLMCGEDSTFLLAKGAVGSCDLNWRCRKCKLLNKTASMLVLLLTVVDLAQVLIKGCTGRRRYRVGVTARRRGDVGRCRGSEVYKVRVLV